jgi:hypothetical protein
VTHRAEPARISAMNNGIAKAVAADVLWMRAQTVA